MVLPPKSVSAFFIPTRQRVGRIVTRVSLSQRHIVKGILGRALQAQGISQSFIVLGVLC